MDRAMLEYKIRRVGAHAKRIIPNALCSLFPMQNEIVFESNPDFTCNSYALFKYMISKGVNYSYKITWVVDSPEKFKAFHFSNVCFVRRDPRDWKDKFITYRRINRAKIAISCNRPFSKLSVSKKQLNIYLDHGSQLKSMKRNGLRCTLDCDYYICQSKFFAPINASEYTLCLDQIICTGLPRNDELFHTYDSIKEILPNYKEYNKIIIWAPTFRKHSNGSRIDCTHQFPYGLPLIYSQEDLLKLNDVLCKTQTIILLKPHPVQDLSALIETHVSNIITINNDDLFKANIQLNELLPQTDALITDYSSIYYDYLLLKKPIGLTVDDVADYSAQKGFAIDNVDEIIIGDKLNTVNDLIQFIKNVSVNIDPLFCKRSEICNKINDYQDDKASERVYSFIFSHTKK